MKLVFSISEVADMLGISLNHAYAMAKTGQIPSVKLGRRMVVPIDSLNRKINVEEGKES